MSKKVDLSLRLSQVDPEAAKRKRKAAQGRKVAAAGGKKKLKLGSDGEDPGEPMLVACLPHFFLFLSVCCCGPG